MATTASRGSSRTSSRTQSQAHSPSQPAAPSASKSTSASSTSPSVSTHLAMVELKQRILAALSKLSDRDTHQIAVDDLEKIIRALPSDGVPMLLSSLLHEPSVDPSRQAPISARRECLRLVALLCSTHPEAAAAHLPKIISHVVRRVKDSSSDTSVRDACRDTAGSLSSLYLRTSGDLPSENYASVVSLFVKPLLEAMGEQNRSVQAAAAACLAKVVECAGDGEGGQRSSAVVATAFQKLCPRICKFLGGQSFLAKGALLSVVSSLSQVGAITSQSMPPLLQIVRECLENNDWATRKSAADTLCVLASHSSHLLVGDNAASIVTALESCRFDKVRPVRDSMTEALLVWKKVAGKGENEEQKEYKDSPLVGGKEKLDNKKSNTNDETVEKSANDQSSSPLLAGDSVAISKGTGIPEKAVVLLKKKAPSLTDKELNLEFFQKLETRNSDDLPVEVVVPRSCLQSSHVLGNEVNNDSSIAIASHDGEQCQGVNNVDDSNDYAHAFRRRKTLFNNLQDPDESTRDRLTLPRIIKGRDSQARSPENHDRAEVSHKDFSGSRSGASQVDGHSDPFMNNKGSWLAIQRQLALLERQQASLMNMLQDFMGGSHDSMVTLENRVRGLERVVEEMARDLSLSSSRRGGSMLMGFEGSPGRSSSKFNSFPDYPNGKFSWGDGRLPFSERFLSSDGMMSGIRGRDPPWRPDAEAWDPYAYAPSKNGIASSKRVLGGASADSRLSRSERDNEQISNRRAWDKGPGPFRLGEGPSARSVWQASKDEATLEAIRVAGEDNGSSRTAKKVPVPDLDAETVGDDNSTQDRGQLWASWNHAMDSLHVGDMDSAYAEVLSTGDDLLLVKLMDRSGPVLDQLSNEVAGEVVHALGQFLLEQSLLDIALSWIQQLAELVAENGPDLFSLKIESKRDILLSLHEASAKDPPEDWEGATAEQMMLHLASTWGINLQQLIK